MNMPLSTHHPFSFKPLPTLLGNRPSMQDLTIFARPCVEQALGISDAASIHDNPPATHAVLILFGHEEADFLEQLISFLCQQQCCEVAQPIEKPQIIEVAEPPTYQRPPDFLVPNDPFLVKINTIIETNMEDEDYRPAKLAKSCFICEMQLYRKLKKRTQLSPSNYIRKYRIWRSRTFLTDLSLTISDVACRVGIRSLEYFSRSFKQEFGQSPTMFRVSLSG
jgi:AraC-like DNA-binding protein